MRTLLKGFVADGINEPRRMCVLVTNDTITAVEKEIYGSSAAELTLEFRDEIIAPGFIDVHGHSDISILADPEAESKRYQGVTSEITGNCGLSPFPVTGKNREHLESLYSGYGITRNWNDFDGYRKKLDSTAAKLRIFPLCGHNTLRAAVAGYEKKQLDDKELHEMQKILDDTLKSGSPGLSTGLLYTPGCFASTGEIVALMQVIAANNKVYATHLRSEGNNLIESIHECLSAAQSAGLKKVEISHFKTAGKDNWHKINEAFEIISRYRAKGMDVRFDRYPYTESQTMLSVILPPPYDTMSDRDITIALKDASCREMLRLHLRENRQNDWQRWRLTGTSHPEWKKFAGMKYSELPADPASAVIEQLAFDATTATIGAAGMSKENMMRIINSPLCMAGSDGNALPFSEKFGRAHPRAFGAIANFIRLKLDSSESIGNTVKAVTGDPADFFALPGVGHICGGKKADITVFSPDEIASDADFISPHQPAKGICLTMMNGYIDRY